MKTRNHIRSLIFILIPVLLFSSCNALKRGDFMRQVDNALFFSEIGFRVSDNPGLSRDAITKVSGTDKNIEIIVPYDADTTTPLVISFNLTAKDATVGYWIGPGPDDFVECVSGVTSLIFNSGSAPESRQLRIFKESPSPDGGDIRTEDYNISVNKIITPRLYNTPKEDEVAPFTESLGNPIILAFVDEDGVPLPSMDANGIWNTDQMYLSWDGQRVHVTNVFNPTPPPNYLVPPYTAGPPAGYQLDVFPLYPGEHQIQVNYGLYRDNQGYFSRDEELVFVYSPPPVYLSQSGSDSNNGLTKTTPVKTFSRAMAIASTIPIFDLYIEASPTPYDTAGANTIDGSVLPLNIFGSWQPGFTSRYTEDWETRPPTILTNSTQGNGVSALSPTAVLNYQNMPITAVLDGVQLNGWSDIDNGTALLLDNSHPQINEMVFYAPQGSGSDATAVTVIGGSDLRMSGCWFFGKDGGAGPSAGLRVENSTVNIDGGLILSGDLTGESIGIDANNSDIWVNYSYILSGVMDPDNNTRTESSSYGIRALDSFVNLENAWINASEATTTSEAINYGDSSTRGIWIYSSTLISERAGTAYGLNVVGPGLTADVNMFNTVVMAGKSTAGQSVGLRMENASAAQIMNNAINVKDGSAAADSYGIQFIGPVVPATDIRNNLIWSERTAAFQGIRAQTDISTETFHNNDFWDDNGTVEVRLDGTDRTIADAHSSIADFQGNVCLAVPVDLDYSYQTEDLDVGRINGTVPPDIKFGGEDLSSSGMLVPGFPGYSDWEKFDRDSNDPPNAIRTGYAKVGWSMGPYEYDSGAMPTSIYVAEPIDGGDDKHPLGTMDAPFASLNQAYKIARTDVTGLVRTDVMDIRMAEGIYNTSTMPLISSVDGVNIRGGYQPGAWTRDPSPLVTELQSSSSEVLAYDNAGSISEHLLEQVTLRNIAGSGTTDALVVRNSTRITIQNSVLTAGIGNQSRGLTVQDSSPRVLGNEITGGSSGGESVGVWLLNAPDTELDGNDISAGSGNPSRGIYIQNSSGVTVESNRIYGGASNSSYGVFLLDAPDSSFHDNTIFGGTGTETHGIYLQNNGPHFIDGNAIYGGNGSSTSYGLRQINASNSYIANNMIHGGNSNGAGGFTRGVDIDGGSDLEYIYNNTIFGGYNSNSNSAAIHTTNSAAPYVINNIIVAGVGVDSASSFAYWQETAAAPIRFLNNILISLDPSSIPYRDNAGDNKMNLGDMETYLNTAGTDVGANQVDFSVPPALFFTNFIPATNNGMFANENWHLIGTDPLNTALSGYDLSSDPFYSFTWDKDGNGRNNPWSVGAYEF